MVSVPNPHGWKMDLALAAARTAWGEEANIIKAYGAKIRILIKLEPLWKSFKSHVANHSVDYD